MAAQAVISKRATVWVVLSVTPCTGTRGFGLVVRRVARSALKAFVGAGQGERGIRFMIETPQRPCNRGMTVATVCPQRSFVRVGCGMAVDALATDLVGELQAVVALLA